MGKKLRCSHQLTISQKKERSIVEMAMERKHNDQITFEIAEHLAVIGTKEDGWSKELNLVSWNGQRPPKFDIREWSPDHTKMSKGITLFDYEMRKISRAYTKFCNARTVSEGRNNKNAAAEAGLRAGAEAAREMEEAENEARSMPFAEVETVTNEVPSDPQDVSYSEDDFNAPGLSESMHEETASEASQEAAAE